MSSTTTETVTPRGSITTTVEPEDAFKNKVIEVLFSAPEIQKASATYSKVKDLEGQIRTRDEKLANLQKDIKAHQEKESLVIEPRHPEGDCRKKVVALLKEVKDRDNSLAEISRRYQDLHCQLQTQLSARSQDEKSTKSMIAQHNLKIDSFQIMLKEKDASINELKKSDATLASRLADEEAKSKHLEQDKKSLDGKLLETRNRLEKIDSFILKQHEIDEESIIDGFSGLWNFATSEIWTVLRQDLDEGHLRNNEPWRKLRQDTDTFIRDGALQGQPVPLCASNSEAAKGMRLAVMLAILSRQIDKEIFQPSHFPSETGHLRLSLNKLARSDNKREQFYRSVLLSIDRDGQEAELRSRASSLVRNVCHYLYEFLPTPQYEELRERITNVVNRAIEFWRPIQTSTRKYETEFDFTGWVHEEDPLFQFPVGGEDPIGAARPDDPFLVIFPGLYCLESETVVLASVVPLMSSQKLYLAANQELRDEVRGKASPTTKQLSRKRQNSVAQVQLPPNGTSFLGKQSSGGSSH
ncbi:uncharacterized protein N7500_008176 [Penicillium coprophilum]|uniref:uncharacterized protein n=1 Tax=Penicillium coprophilum TaxID=36646 RepID=UPI00238B5F6F|nr:uncharacterized protein N7500_008176 [Penicillium coprophilum]KAJ5158525.1 hypothetical protein N7500_008176 [Penicillium coprophilum]